MFILGSFLNVLYNEKKKKTKNYFLLTFVLKLITIKQYDGITNIIY